MKSRAVYSLPYWATGRQAVSSSGLQFQQKWQKPKSCTCFSLILCKGPWFPRTNPLGEMRKQAWSPMLGVWGNGKRGLVWEKKASQKRFCWGWALKVVRAPLAKGAEVREVADHVSCRGWEAGMPSCVAMTICQCTVTEQGLGCITYL